MNQSDEETIPTLTDILTLANRWHDTKTRPHNSYYSEVVGQAYLDLANAVKRLVAAATPDSTTTGSDDDIATMGEG